MSDDKFDFIFVINKKSYLRYGTPDYELFLIDIFQNANFYSGEYEITFKTENGFEELSKDNFEEFVSLDYKEVNFKKKLPRKNIQKLIEAIKLMIEKNKLKFLCNFYEYMKKEKEKRKLELKKKLLLNKMQLIISQKNNYEKKLNKYTFTGFNRVRGDMVNDLLEQQSVNESAMSNKLGQH